jgi:hypothetical protein
MLLTKNDIGKIVTAAVGAGGIPDFLQQFREGSGLIYGIGPAISEYWTAYELYEVVKQERSKNPDASLQAFSNADRAYAVFCKYVTQNNQNDGKDILARSNEFIQFSGADELKVRVRGRRTAAADSKQLSMEISNRTPQQRQQFFERFDQTSYAIGQTLYGSVKEGIEKDWLGTTQSVDQSGYSPRNITSMRQFMVRRACKFLLYDEISIRHGRIFYALDGLTLADVAQRGYRALDRSRSKVPVCTSELREIFRMWAFLHNHVAFYLHLENSEPPWKLSDQEQWSAYAVERSKKVLVNDEEKTKKIARLSELHAKQQYDKVIDEYHGIPAHRLKRASLPFELRDDQEMDQAE